MTDGQEAHLQSIKDQFLALVDPKFRAGANEHKTILHELSPEWLLDQALDEAIDQVVYLLTLKERLSANDGTDRT